MSPDRTPPATDPEDRDDDLSWGACCFGWTLIFGWIGAFWYLIVGWILS